MRYFCTYFDHHYLPRGLALYQSLRRHCPSFELWVLCMDRLSYDVLSQLGLSDVHLISLEDVEKGDEELLRAKQNRSMIEYYFTFTPSLPLYILHHYPEVEMITYLDSDLFFFDDPAPIYTEIADHSIAIVGHRFPPHLRDLECFGIYNVGWLSFRRDERALACLRWWRDRCIEWCYDRCEDGRFADQKYLDHWPSLFQGVVVLRQKGANLAPWNLANYTICPAGDRVWVDDQPLIFFHFHGLKQVTNWLYDPNWAVYEICRSEVVLQRIYAPYILSLLDAIQLVQPLLGNRPLRSSLRGHTLRSQSLDHSALLLAAARHLRGLLRVCRRILARQCFFVINGRVI